MQPSNNIRERFLCVVATIQARGRSAFLWKIAIPYFMVARALWTIIFDGILAPQVTARGLALELFWDAVFGGIVFGGAIGLWIWHVWGLNRWPQEPSWWARVLPPVPSAADLDRRRESQVGSPPSAEPRSADGRRAG